MENIEPLLQKVAHAFSLCIYSPQAGASPIETDTFLQTSGKNSKLIGKINAIFFSNCIGKSYNEIFMASF